MMCGGEGLKTETHAGGVFEGFGFLPEVADEL